MFARLFGTNVQSKPLAKPHQPHQSAGGVLLNNHSIDVSITNRYATISYSFDFENTSEYGSTELKFEITISPDSFISGFTADIDGDIFHGITKERKVAKREYIVAKSKDENAILISQIDKDIPNLFRIQTNIDSESTISLKITIEQYIKKQFNFNQLNVEILRDFDKYNISRNYQYIPLHLNIKDRRGIYDIILPFTDDNILQIQEKKMDKREQNYQMKGKLMYEKTKMTEMMLKYKVKGEQSEYCILYDTQSRTFCHIMSDIITDAFIDNNDISEGDNDQVQENTFIPRRVVFIIDRSYSMHGHKWKKTIASTIKALKQLRPNYDRFSIIFFDQNMQQFIKNKMVLASDQNIKDAISYVEHKSLGGSTDINTPLLHGIKLIKNDIALLNGEPLQARQKYVVNTQPTAEDDELAQLQAMMEDTDVQRVNKSKDVDIVEETEKSNDIAIADAYNFYMNQIIFITDGEPNNGERNTSNILLNVAQANDLKNMDKYCNKISIFAFGVGRDSNDSSWTSDLNHSFLKLLSVNNNGIYKRVKETNCDTQLDEYYEILSRPILSDIKVSYDAHNITNITNKKFNTLFHGNDIIVCGQFTDDKCLQVKATISAITGKQIKENDKFITKPIHIHKYMEISIPQTSNDVDNNNTERIWAYLKLQQFAKQKLIHNDMIEMDEDETKENEELPLSLAMKYKFVTPWTSMIVVKQKEGNQKKKKKKKKKPKQQKQTQQPIDQLRSAIQQLRKRESHLEKRISACLSAAKAKSKQRDKKGALFELKKKKELEKQLAEVQGKILNIETQIMALEDAHLNKETLCAMKTSANAMESTIKESDLDKADELMEDINEAMDQVVEMNDAMSQPLDQVLDDDELEAELAELEELEADELLNDMSIIPDAMYGDVTDLPSAPQGQIVHVQNDDEEDELAELEAMMDDAPRRQISDDDEEKKEVMVDTKKNIFEAYNDNNIRITFECIASSKENGSCQIVVTFYNKSSEDMTNFNCLVRVETYLKLTVKTANGTTLFGSSKNSITQQFEVINTKYGEKPFAVEIEVTFTQNSEKRTLKSSVKIPDHFV